MQDGLLPTERETAQVQRQHSNTPNVSIAYNSDCGDSGLYNVLGLILDLFSNKHGETLLAKLQSILTSPWVIQLQMKTLLLLQSLFAVSTILVSTLLKFLRTLWCPW